MSNCKVIALTNQKGGAGKTTTAFNLGVSLMQQGKKVLLIDADAQANLTMALGYNRPDDIPITLSTVMQNIIDDKTLDVSRGIIHHREGVDLLPSNIELSGFEVRLINAMSRERVLKTYVNEVKKNYDYVLIDCMPSLGMITINALAAADSVIIPTQPHYLSAKGLELLLRSVSMVKRQINPKLRIDGILMTMVMPRTNISKEITATVKSAYGQKIKVFDTEIPHSIRAVEPTAEGKSIFAYDKSGKVEVALTQLGNEGGQPYWSWYGFEGRVEWCACFVSWCADQCGYIESGIIPKFSGCVDGSNWFKGNGQWQDRNYDPQAGDIIFFDWEGDGETDHVGIVEKCENGVVYTVEGNSGDACRQKQYTVGSSSIYGYGVPAY